MAVELDDRWQPDWVVAPGEILAEALDERSMTQVELARRMGRPLKTVNELVKGKQAITPDTAYQLELVLGVPARFWSNLQRDFDYAAIRAEQLRRLQPDIKWSERFPVTGMVKLGWLTGEGSKARQLSELLRFFGVVSPTAWERQKATAQAAFRHSPAYRSRPEAMSAWLRWGEIQAARIDCAPFDRSKLIAQLPEIRALSVLDPVAFMPDLVEKLANCGIALVVAPELPGTHVSGAARWLSPDKALIQLSLRHKTDDHFWFALFHEIGHLIKGRRRSAYLDVQLDGTSGVDPEEEREANNFASFQLVPSVAIDSLLSGEGPTRNRIRAVAREFGVSPGIVVGQLENKAGLHPSRFRDLKRTWRWQSAI